VSTTEYEREQEREREFGLTFLTCEFTRLMVLNQAQFILSTFASSSL